MLKAVVAATAAVTIAGTSLVVAQPDTRNRWRPSIEDMRAFQAARLAALRAGLVLTPEQDKHWPAFEAAMRELQQLRLTRIAAQRNARAARPTAEEPATRMRQNAARLAETGVILQRLADAIDPLYRSLDEAQRHRFAMLSRIGGLREQRQPGREQPGPRGMRRSEIDPDAAPVGNVMHKSSVKGTYAGRVASEGSGVVQTFVAKGPEGFAVGRVFKTPSGTLAVGEWTLVAERSAPVGENNDPWVSVVTKLPKLDVVHFGPKLTDAVPGASRKIPITGAFVPDVRKI